MEVGQVVKAARGPYCRQVRGVEAEEVDARLDADSHIGANVQFGETGEARKWRQSTPMNVAHVKGDHSDPTLAFPRIKWKLSGDEGAQGLCLHRPMGEKQVVPGLGHGPIPTGQGPGPMGG